MQERLVTHTDSEMRGQVFGLQSTGLMVGQAPRVRCSAGRAAAMALGVGAGRGGAGYGLMTRSLAVAARIV